jgi:putative ABC transport system permease protein
MTFIAIQMLIGDRLKYIGLVLGIAFSALLISQQGSILVGLASQTGSFIRDTSQGDLWVMDDQIRFSQDSLPISDTALLRTRGVDGVEWAVPLFQGFHKARLSDGTRMLCILVGLDDATLIGGPPTMVEGSMADLRRDKGVLIDFDARDNKMRLKRDGSNKPMQLGDRFSINDSEVEVVGTYRATKSFFWEPVIYTTYTRALRMAPQERRLMNYVMVKVKPGQDIPTVAARIEAATGLKVRTGAEFEAITRDFILNETGILVNFGLAVGLGFIVGTLVAGQMLYNFTLDNLRHYAALKAMGTSSWGLAWIVVVQACVVGALGYGVGLGAGSLLGRAVEAGGLAFSMPWWIPVATGVGILCISLLAALLSLSRVLTLEPAMVFKA